MLEWLIALIVMLLVFMIVFPILLGVGLFTIGAVVFAVVVTVLAVATALLVHVFFPLLALAVLWAIGWWAYTTLIRRPSEPQRRLPPAERDAAA